MVRVETDKTAGNMGRHALLREKHKWAIEKPERDNVRRLRGIYFINPEDKEFKETINNARKKLDTPVAPTTLCKISNNNQNRENRGKLNETKSKIACILEGPYCRKERHFTSTF